MGIASDKLKEVSRIELPEKLWFLRKQGALTVWRLQEAASKLSVQASSASGRDPCSTILLESGGEELLVLIGQAKPPKPLEHLKAVRATEVGVADSLLELKNPRWVNPVPGPSRKKILAETKKVEAAWTQGIRFKREVPGKQDGLRVPQQGALHSIAAHCSLKESPSTVVLPTGTGKTEVMIATCMLISCRRVLVIVPSDPLRTQTLQKFQNYGLLPQLGVLEESTPNPIVGLVKGTLKPEELSDLELCNVVVATMRSIDRLDDNLQSKLAGKFSHVFVDEAHHIPARSWSNFKAACLKQGSRVVQFTATPFREDGKKLKDPIIYEFPLSRAQSEGYFKQIRFIEVFEPDDDLSDTRIAAAAVARLREDLGNNFDHIIMARASNKIKAEALYENLYLKDYADLNPVLIHSSVKNKTEKLQAVREGKHRIVVCVDMFGEGFDLPKLKIAALHDVHKSIGITLQFIGRFTRSSKDVGRASVVANIALENVPQALEGLYRENADWNTLLSDLNFDAMAPLKRLSGFIQDSENLSKGQENEFTLALQSLRPKTSAVVFQTRIFKPEEFRRAFRKEQRILQPHYNQKENTLVFVVNQKDSVDWSQSSELESEAWDLYLLHYNPTTELLFIHSSRRNARFERLAEVVSVEPKRLAGETVFKVLSGLQRLVLHNIGLTSRSRNVRYRMFAGLDIGTAIDPSTQVNSIKSNITGVGFEQGERKSAGCSYKGKIWSLSSSTVPEWCDWCTEIGLKLTDPNAKPDDFLNHTMVPRETEELPDSVALMADWPDQLFMTSNFRFSAYKGEVEHDFHDCQLELVEANPKDSVFRFALVAGQFRQTYQVSISKDAVKVTHLSGNKLEIRSRRERVPGHEFFQENPPILRFADGSMLSGNILLTPRKKLPTTFDIPNQFRELDWGSTELKTESIWKDGSSRSNTVQGFFLEYLKANNSYSFLIDDDDQGESADIVAILVQASEIIVDFFHCKYSGEEKAGNRASDLYEVCGQAQKSTKWTWSFKELVDHLRVRETKHLRGRPTRFHKGNLRALINLRRESKRKRVLYRISVVQPGIKKSSIPNHHIAILGATDGFIRCITNNPLRVYGSA